MNILEKFLAGAFAATFLVVILDRGNSANQILRGFADFNASTFRVLQGRG